MRAIFRLFLFFALALVPALAARAEMRIRQIDTQYIAALASPGDSHGSNAATWGLWAKDPGPRGVWLDLYPALALAGTAPAGWKFNGQDWWLEEHGLIMEQPQFPLPAGQYVVTGGRQVTTVLTVGEPDADGNQTWQLADGATLADVTHMACRSARYTPATQAACSPEQVRRFDFPVSPGAAMPPVADCAKQDYAVLIVIGMVEQG